MKRLVFVMLCCLLIVVPMVSAQDLLWELDGEFTVSDLQLVFDMPSTWVFASDNGVVLAENEADLGAMVDGDDSTQPAGYTIRITAVSLDELGVDELALEDTATALIESQGISITESYEVTVMARQAFGIAGINPAGRAGIAHFWQQDEMLVIFTLGTPDSEISQDVAFTWGVINGLMRPQLPDNVEVESVALNDLGIEVSIPNDWVSTASGNFAAFFDTQDNADTFSQTNELSSEDSTMLITVQTLDELGLASNTTVEDLVDWTGVDYSQQGFTDQGKFNVLDQPGFGFSLIDPDTGTGTYSVITLSDDGTVTIYNLVTPDADTLTELTPVFITLLKSATE